MLYIITYIFNSCTLYSKRLKTLHFYFKGNFKNQVWLDLVLYSTHIAYHHFGAECIISPYACYQHSFVFFSFLVLCPMVVVYWLIYGLLWFEIT